MNIGIIGAGSIGGTLAAKLHALGHTVYLANSRGPESLQDLAQQTGATAVTSHEAAQRGEIVIVTIPQKSIPALPADLFAGVAPEVVVVDTCNYYPTMRDGVLPGLDADLTDSQWVQQHLGRPVVKAFNSIAYTSLADGSQPAGAAGRIGLPVASDEPRAKEIVMHLVDELGFTPVDAGTLQDSWKQQPGSDIYCRDMPAAEIEEHLTEMGPSQTPKQQATLLASRAAQEAQILAYYASQQPS